MLNVWWNVPHRTDDLKQSLVLGWLADEWFQAHYCLLDTLKALHVLRDHYGFLRPLCCRQVPIDIGKCFFALRPQDHFSLLIAQTDCKLLSTHHVILGQLRAGLIDSCQELIHAAASKLRPLLIGQLVRLTSYLVSLSIRYCLLVCFTSCLWHASNIYSTLFLPF